MIATRPTSTIGVATSSASSRSDENPGGRMRRGGGPRRSSASIGSNYARARFGYERNIPPGGAGALCASRAGARLLARWRGSRARFKARAGARDGPRPRATSRERSSSRGFLNALAGERWRARERRISRRRVRGRVGADVTGGGQARRCATARAVLWAWLPASAVGLARAEDTACGALAQARTEVGADA